MVEMAKTEEGLERINEGVDRYVAERVEEGDQHAPQGGIAGNGPHIVPFPENVPFDPTKTALQQPHFPPTLMYRLPAAG